MTDRLFPLDDVPEVPLLREPRRRRGAQVMDERLDNDYPPEWSCCETCGGSGEVSLWGVVSWHADFVEHLPTGTRVSLTERIPNGVRGLTRDEAVARLAEKIIFDPKCPDCKGMGSVKARVRLEAGHRCVRCAHPYMPKGDAKMLGVEPSPGRWSACDEKCTHGGPLAIRVGETWVEAVRGPVPSEIGGKQRAEWDEVFAEWRILTVHHLTGDKSDCRWGNLVALCQRCHLEIQHKVVMERVYPHEHSTWFKPHAAWWYALSYLGEDLSREQVMVRLDELLALERSA